MLYKEVFGLDISDTSIEAVQLKKVGKKIKLFAFGRTELEKGVVEDGKIFQKEELAKIIKSLLLKTLPKPISTSYVVISLPESKVFTHIFKFPKVLSKEQIKKALKYEAEAIIPLEPEEIYWDFKVISKTENEQEVFYAACQKEIINDFREVLKKAGLFPLVFEMESLAIARSLISPTLLEKEEGILIADIGARTTILSIFDRNGIRSSVNVPVAGNKFTEAIAEKLKISLSEAEELKKKYGLDETKEKGKIVMILQSILQPILDEIEKSIKYYEKQTGRKIKKILLVGGSAAMPKIDSYLNDNIGLPVKIGKSWLDIKLDSKKVPPILLVNAIGLALRGIERNLAEVDINLLPLETPEMIKKVKFGKVSQWLGRIYAKLSRKYQILNLKEWIRIFKIINFF